MFPRDKCVRVFNLVNVRKGVSLRHIRKRKQHFFPREMKQTPQHDALVLVWFYER